MTSEEGTRQRGSGSSPAAGGREASPRPTRRRGTWLAACLVAALLLLAQGALAASPSPAADEPSPVTSDARGSASPADAASAPASPSPSPADSSPAGRTALVPVVSFWSRRRDLSLDELRAAWHGEHARFDRLVVAMDHLPGLAQLMGAEPGPDVATDSPEKVVAAVKASVRVLGLVPAEAVEPSVRALGIDGAHLYGTRRVASLDQWPLTMAARDPGGSGPEVPAFDPARTWTLVAGGDVMLDRRVYHHAVTLGKGPGHPWDGGFARITSRTCCSERYGGPEITVRRTGDRGAVRALLQSADLAVVNHEGPAPDRFTHHPDGVTFTFDPALEAGLAGAGIDLVSLANNHIGNAGPKGVLQTIRNVRAHGIRTVGAGRDERTARRPTCLEVRDVRVCFLAYTAIGVALNGATDDRPGAATLRIDAVRRDIRRARRSGADVVMVLPHWGFEYRARPTARQQRQAARMAEAGADAILGAHSHWAGAMGEVAGMPVLYSMGNLIFDHPRHERTLEGIIVEMTFHGDRLAQLELHPTVFVGGSQANLLARAADGRVVLERMRRASQGLLDW